MPLLKRKPFSLLEPPNDLEPRELVFQVRFTKEIFRDYQYPPFMIPIQLLIALYYVAVFLSCVTDSLSVNRDYLKRISLYHQRVWTCKVTGKTNLKYEEALISEQRAAKKIQQFPEELIEPVLRIVQFSMLPLSDLARKIRLELQGSLVEGVELNGKKDGYVHPCRIVKVLDKEAGKTCYEVAWLDDDGTIDGSTVVGEEDLVHKKLPFGREIIKSYIRESTYRSFPWVINNNLATKYGISTDPPEDLKNKISVLNGYVVDNKKRKKNEQGNAGKHKRNKLEGKKSDGPSGYNDVENGNDSSRYPIEDQLVQPDPDDPIFADRPLPLRDFSIQMDCVGDLLMVWDFCSSFGRLLYLWPFSLEDFEKAILHQDSNIALIVETHVTLLRLLIMDGGEYYMFLQEKSRKAEITSITWAEYLCDFLEMINTSELTTHMPTIKSGHYGLLDACTKLKILKTLVDQTMATVLLRVKLEEHIEQRHALGALKRGEALEEGKKKREAKEHLKAVSEANGAMSDHNSDAVEYTSSVLEEDLPIKCLLGKNGQVLENGNFLKKFSEQNHLLLHSESDHQVNGLREKTKKLLEELEKSKEQRKEFLRKEMEKRVIRTNSLGKDRDHNRYWFFRRDGRLFVESSDFKQWGYYSSKEVLDALISSLNPKGMRERALKKQLERHYVRICKEMQKRSKQVAQKVTKEDAVARRSTRVQAPPEDNPALAFLKYSNKWKVLMD